MFFFFFNSDDFIPSTKRDPEISKAIYKFNRSIAKGSSLLKLDQLLPKKNLMQTTPEQISFLKGILEHQFIDSHQAKIIKSILLIVETMPINKSITFVEDNYFKKSLHCKVIEDDRLKRLLLLTLCPMKYN